MPKNKGFEEYLQEQHSLEYSGLKDLMIDGFNDWLDGLSTDEWIEFGDKFAKEGGIK